MINPRALKGFLFSFLLILAGGLVFIGSAVLYLSTAADAHNSGTGAIMLIGLALILLGLVIGLVSCGA